MLPDTAPQDAIERLRRLPFIEALHDGLGLHETFRAARPLRCMPPTRVDIDA